MKQKHPLDYLILGITIILTLFGLVMVFSASFYLSQYKGGEGTYFLIKQLVGAGIGLGTLLVACYLPYKIYNHAFVPFAMMGISVVLLVAVLFTKEVNNVNRFLTIAGVQFQPSEIGRVSLILFIAWWVSGHSEDLRSKNFKRFLFKGIGMPLLATGLITGLVLMGKNLSMAASTLMIALVMLLVAGVDWRPFVLLLTGGAGFAVIFTVLEPYRLKRLMIFLDPWKDPKDTGYQLVQSLYGLGAGGLFGVGLGNSRQKLLFLPYAESDFILSIIGEEFGFIGMMLLMAAFWILVWRGMLVSAKAPDEFGMMLAAGITALFAIQFLINILVVTASMPPTGVPLPFISNGNTSLVVFMTAVGILLNVSRHQVKT